MSPLISRTLRRHRWTPKSQQQRATPVETASFFFSKSVPLIPAAKSAAAGTNARLLRVSGFKAAPPNEYRLIEPRIYTNLQGLSEFEFECFGDLGWRRSGGKSYRLAEGDRDGARSNKEFALLLQLEKTAEHDWNDRHVEF